MKSGQNQRMLSRISSNLSKGNAGKSGIVYCLSRKKVEELAETLVVNGIKALPYHAGLDAPTRRQNQDKFLMEEVDVIVATIAFGMGIDKPDVRFVIHYDMPKSLEGYYQETGRAGRDDGEGNCIAFYSYDDIQKLEKFMKGKPVAEQEIAKQLLLETVSYANPPFAGGNNCSIISGRLYKEDNCQNCDNCLHPKKKFEGNNMSSSCLILFLPSNSNSSKSTSSISSLGKTLPPSNHTSTISWMFSGKAPIRMKNSGMP